MSLAESGEVCQGRERIDAKAYKPSLTELLKHERFFRPSPEGRVMTAVIIDKIPG